MSHTYASLPTFKDFLRDGGSSGTATTNDALWLGVLESASRAVERFTDRSRFGSGYGPRTGTNKYDNWGPSNIVAFEDDLLSTTAVTLLDTTNGVSLGSVAVSTDYYLQSRSNYDTPYRALLLHGMGSVIGLGWGYQVSQIAGSWGYQDVQTAVGTIGSASSSTTSIALSGGSAYAGQTVLVDSEQMYVTASTGGTALTVRRGQNGTTAAGHAASTAATVYVYPPEVSDATLQIAQRRWKARDAGSDGSFGGGPIPVQLPTAAASEVSILSRTVGHLKVYHVG